MKRFKYKAKDSRGKTVTGLVEAADQKRAVITLQERNLVIIHLELVEANLVTKIFDKVFRHVSLTDVATFTRQLSTMITTGLTVTTALDIIKNQSPPALEEVIDDVLRNVESGVSLADSLKKHPRIFDQVYVALVSAGEKAGVLDQVLARLADNLEKKREFNSKVKGAMIYPAVVVVGMVVVATIMMIFVIPKMMSLYSEFQAKLPTPTLILIGISNFMASFWWLIFGILGVGFFFLSNFLKTPFGRRKKDSFILKIPVFGNLQTQIVLTETTRTLGLLVGAGVSIIEALNITASVVGNVIFQERLNEASKQVERGVSLAETFSTYEEFPRIIPQMVSIGEETGKMDEVLLKVSRYFEQESEEKVKGLTNIIEPLIMVVLGVGVGFLVIAIILPIYNLTSQF